MSKEYSVRYSAYGTLTAICRNGKTMKYTYEEAVEKVKEYNEKPEVKCCKIYKGRTLIETIKAE